MVRSVLILALGAMLTGCAAGHLRTTQPALIDEITGEIQTLSYADPPQEKPPQDRPATPKPATTPRETPKKTTPPQEKKTPFDVEEQKEPAWERMPRAVEEAIIREHFRKTQPFRDHSRARRWGVTGHAELVFATDEEAVSGFQSSELKWNELVEKGWGAGLELSYELVPVFQPLLGVKYDGYKGGTKRFEDQGVQIELDASEFETVPFFAGFRVNFPLNMATGKWFDPAAAGQTHGLIPYFQVGAGGAWNFGSEINVKDLTNLITNKLDFVRRGLSGYVEGSIGVEYRDKKGHAFRISVGIEAYPGLKLDRKFEKAIPGSDLERLDQAFLPRISFSYYF